MSKRIIEGLTVFICTSSVAYCGLGIIQAVAS